MISTALFVSVAMMVPVLIPCSRIVVHFEAGMSSRDMIVWVVVSALIGSVRILVVVLVLNVIHLSVQATGQVDWTQNYDLMMRISALSLDGLIVEIVLLVFVEIHLCVNQAVRKQNYDLRSSSPSIGMIVLIVVGDPALTTPDSTPTFFPIAIDLEAGALASGELIPVVVLVSRCVVALVFFQIVVRLRVRGLVHTEMAA